MFGFPRKLNSSIRTPLTLPDWCQLDGLTFLGNSEYIEKTEFVFAQPKTSC